MNHIFTAQMCEMTKFSNLFIELTAKNCNQRCKNCYIDFPINKNVKDFINIDLIKKALSDLSGNQLDCIYLTGAEPMTHPDFNLILRLCLKYSNVCICTNGSFINEKKARFLRKIEDESDYELIFQLSLYHYDEIKNDDARSRGSFRQVFNAVKSLVKYDFNPILCVTDFYHEGSENLIRELKSICLKNGFNTRDNNFKINEFVDVKNPDWEHNLNLLDSIDCKFGRILTSQGVYACPFLANDHRGRSGTDLKNFSLKTPLETDYCSYCLKNGKSFFSIDYSLF